MGTVFSYVSISNGFSPALYCSAALLLVANPPTILPNAITSSGNTLKPPKPFFSPPAAPRTVPSPAAFCDLLASLICFLVGLLPIAGTGDSSLVGIAGCGFPLVMPAALALGIKFSIPVFKFLITSILSLTPALTLARLSALILLVPRCFNQVLSPA